MNANEFADKKGIELRSARALTEVMSVCDFGDGDAYTVVSSSGREYTTTLTDCDCPDATHRDALCKHSRRVAFELGYAVIPPAIDEDDIDDQLGEHLEDADVRFAADLEASPDPQADAGKRAVAADGGRELPDPKFTYHIESPKVGGARYVRCEGCGSEVIPADPDRVLHREGCPVAASEEDAAMIGGGDDG